MNNGRSRGLTRNTLHCWRPALCSVTSDHTSRCRKCKQLLLERRPNSGKTVTQLRSSVFRFPRETGCWRTWRISCDIPGSRHSRAVAAVGSASVSQARAVTTRRLPLRPPGSRTIGNVLDLVYRTRMELGCFSTLPTVSREVVDHWLWAVQIPSCVGRIRHSRLTPSTHLSYLLLYNYYYQP